MIIITIKDMQSVENLFDRNRDGNPTSQVFHPDVQLNHGEVFSENTAEVLYIFKFFKK
jgi:hypothetical protein